VGVDDPSTIRIYRHDYDPLLLAFGGAARRVEFWIREYGREEAEKMALDMSRWCSIQSYRLAFRTAFGG